MGPMDSYAYYSSGNKSSIIFAHFCLLQAQTLFILILGFGATVLYYISSHKTSKRTHEQSDTNEAVEHRENGKHSKPRG